jgi:hypothetical protein
MCLRLYYYYYYYYYFFSNMGSQELLGTTLLFSCSTYSSLGEELVYHLIQELFLECPPCVDTLLGAGV